MVRKKTDESSEDPLATPAEVREEELSSSADSAPAPQPAPPTDFAMSLTEFGSCRNLKPSVLAGLKAFLNGDVRPRKLSAWDSMLEKYLKS